MPKMIKNAVYIETYGCQMNKLDSETISSILAAEGYNLVNSTKAADVIILNTCGVRENAENRIHGRVGELSSLRKEKPWLLFGIAGCMAQRLGDKLLSPIVRIVAGPDSYREFPSMIRKAQAESVLETGLDTSVIYEGIEPQRENPYSAWVAIMRGCNNFCSYCVVPYTRGRERSIPLKNIINEITELRDKGYKEVTLLGQNVNSYQYENTDFAGLLETVAGTGIGWVRFMTSHPKNLTERILDIIASNPNVCNHLHLPLQSGSNKILSAMNRKYTVESYLALVDKARERVGDISITTDLIFGFPGETDSDFETTMEIMERVRYNYAFLYRYSEREGTPAYEMTDSVPEHIRIERLRYAIEIQQKISHERNAEEIGKTRKMLIKSRSKDMKGWFGLTESSIPAVVYSQEDNFKEGDFANMIIESTTGASLIGRAV